jgi:hypothetical protein
MHLMCSDRCLRERVVLEHAVPDSYFLVMFSSKKFMDLV